jgi:hypothetical protein
MQKMIKTIRIDTLVIDPAIQQRADGLDRSIAESYAEDIKSGCRLPPCIAFDDGEKRYLAEGFHRIAAMRSLDREAVDCDLRKGTREDAIMLACGANAEHGARRTNADKRQAVTTMLGLRSQWSDRRIAEICKVDHRFVGHMREQLGTVPTTTGGVSPRSEPEPREGRDGKKYRPPQKRNGRSLNGNEKPMRDPEYGFKLLTEYFVQATMSYSTIRQQYGSIQSFFSSEDWRQEWNTQALNMAIETLKDMTQLVKEIKQCLPLPPNVKANMTT